MYMRQNINVTFKTAIYIYIYIYECDNTDFLRAYPYNSLTISTSCIYGQTRVKRLDERGLIKWRSYGVRTSPTSGGRSEGIVRLRTTATEFSFYGVITDTHLWFQNEEVTMKQCTNGLRNVSLLLSGSFTWEPSHVELADCGLRGGKARRRFVVALNTSVEVGTSQVR
jgi:hypothetical protein